MQEEARNVEEKLQKGIPSIPLTQLTALISAFSNDVDADWTYAQMVFALGKKADVFIGLSTSGGAKNVRYGAITKATSDGRKEGEPFSKNLSPVIGMDRGGITTLLNSVGKIDFSQFPHAGMLDLILHPTAVSGDDGLNAFGGLVKAYFAKGGHSLQFNIFSAEGL